MSNLRMTSTILVRFEGAGASFFKPPVELDLKCLVRFGGTRVQAQNT